MPTKIFVHSKKDVYQNNLSTGYIGSQSYCRMLSSNSTKKFSLCKTSLITHTDCSWPITHIKSNMEGMCLELDVDNSVTIYLSLPLQIIYIIIMSYFLGCQNT